MKTHLPLVLVASLTLGHLNAQTAFSYPSAIPAFGVYTYDVRTAVVALQELPSVAPFDLGLFQYGPPTVLHRAFSPSSGTLYENYIPDATHCSFEYATAAPDTDYVYMNISPNTLALVGTGSETGGVSIYEDHWNIYTFPCVVGPAYTDAFNVDGQDAQGSTTMIAKGDLNTPYGSHSNVVFLSRSTDFGFGQFDTYFYYADNDAVNPIAMYDAGAEELTLYTPTGFSAQGIQENVVAPLRIAPNPARDEHISISGVPRNATCTVSVINTTGQDVLRRTTTATALGTVGIAAEELAPGTYTVTVVCKDGVDRRTRLVIVR